jgi:hypothetical protein
LFVFLYGGHGGPGAGPGRGQQIMENKDCIFVNLPLFKMKIDPDGPFKGKGIFYLHGDYAGQDDWLGRKMREDQPKAVKKLEDAIAAHQLNATGLVMKDTGHDMPVKFDADVKAWVLKQLAQ